MKIKPNSFLDKLLDQLVIAAIAFTLLVWPYLLKGMM